MRWAVTLLHLEFVFAGSEVDDNSVESVVVSVLLEFGELVADAVQREAVVLGQDGQVQSCRNGNFAVVCKAVLG